MARIFKKNNKNNGFTLLELVIVFAMLSIIMATLTINFKTSSSSLALQRAAFKLSTDIRRAQATAGVKADQCCSPDPPGCHIKYRYGCGISFDKITKSDKEYKVFSDCNGNNRFNPPDTFDVWGTVQIEKGVKICNLYVGATDASGTGIDLLFVPPDPFVFVDGSRAIDPVTIRICLEKDNTKTKDVIVNRVGMIEIK